MEESFIPFLNQHFKNEAFRVYQLAGDASTRKYYRVIKDQSSMVLMKWEPFDPDNYPFLSVLNHFAKNKVQVPQVLAMSASEGLVLLEDLGDLTLERKFWESQDPESSMDFYHRTLDELLKIHFDCTKDRSPCTAFNIEFDTEKLLWEMNYGKDNLIIGVCGFNMNSQLSEELNSVFRDVCEKLHRQKKFIAHRDFHSRNVMIKFDELRIIDFQDARLGSVQYDLVSLIKDSYVDIPDSMGEKLLNYYLERAKPHLPDFSREQFQVVYELQSVQRCFKACGSFASFFHQREDRRYLKYISHTLKKVLKSLALFPEYKTFVNVLVDSGALDKEYTSL